MPRAQQGLHPQRPAGLQCSLPAMTPALRPPMQVDLVQTMIADDINSDELCVSVCSPAKCTTSPKYLLRVFE